MGTMKSALFIRPPFGVVALAAAARGHFGKLRQACTHMKLCTAPSLFISLSCLSFSADAQYAWDLLKQPEFKAAYLQVLGKYSREKWLVRLAGPSTETERRVIGGNEFLLAHSCKPHACDTDHIAIAYSRASKRAFVKLHEESGTDVLLGSPPADVKAELEAFHAKQFKVR